MSQRSNLSNFVNTYEWSGFYNKTEFDNVRLGLTPEENDSQF